MRYHLLTIVFKIYQLIKNSFVLILLLFILRGNSEFWLLELGRYAVIIYIPLRILYIIVAWFVEKYEWQDQTFNIYKGVFVRNTRTIPFSRIQNMTRNTTLFHKLFGVTSLTFETSASGEDESIYFPVLSKERANELIELVQLDKRVEQATEEQSDDSQSVTGKFSTQSKRITYFKPVRKDLWKASFTSLSFLAIFPIAYGLYEYVQPFLSDIRILDSFQVILDSVWLFVIVVIVILIVSISFGIARTFLRYGKYEISADNNYIYIDRGVLEESYFSINKKRVQGLEIEQNFLKRLFGLAEVKLISSANPNQEDGSINVNSLYPFLPIQEAYALIEKLLPQYKLTAKLERLPLRSLWVKLLRPSWLWITATILLAIFKPNFLGIAWWVLVIMLLVLTIIQRVLDYIHTRYAISEDQAQWWHGGLTSRMFITKRKNMIEMTYSQSILQKIFQVASIQVKNRSILPRVETINDIPVNDARKSKAWYLMRSKDVNIKNG